MSKTNLPYDRSSGGGLLNVSQIRDRLGCSRSFVYALFGRGEIKKILLGDKKGLRTTRKSLELYLKRRERGEE